jgi:hypothetical protein
MENFNKYVRMMFCLAVSWHIGCRLSKTADNMKGKSCTGCPVSAAETAGR